MSDEIHWNRVAVDPNPVPGGEPVRVGVTHRWTCQAGRDGVREIFAAPIPDAEMPPSLTAAQLRQINTLSDAAGPDQHVEVKRNRDGSGTIVLYEHGHPDRDLMDLATDA